MEISWAFWCLHGTCSAQTCQSSLRSTALPHGLELSSSASTYLSGRSSDFISLATNNMLIPNSFSKYHMVAQPWNYVSPKTPYVLLNWAQLTLSVTTENLKRWARNLFWKTAPNNQRKWKFLQKNAGYNAPWWCKFGYPRLWKHPINSSCVIFIFFFAISLNPSDWVTNGMGGRGWNIMLRCGLEVCREYM